jgi:hypothetical protein
VVLRPDVSGGLPFLRSQDRLPNDTLCLCKTCFCRNPITTYTDIGVTDVTP